MRSPSGSGRVTSRRTPHTGAKKSAPARCLELAAGIGAERHRVGDGAGARGFDHLAAVGPGDQAAKRQRARAHGGVAGDRRAAGAVEHRQEGALAGERRGGVAIVDGVEQRARARVVGARLERDDPLPDRGQEFVGRQNRGGGVGAFQPLQSGERQQGGVDLAGVELAQARLHVAAKVHHREIGTQPLDQRLPAQRRGADDRAMRKLVQRAALAADEGIARILARQHRHDRKPRRQHGRHVLGRMHGEVDAAGEQRVLDLLGEQALAADLRQRAVADHVAAGADDLDADALGREPMRRGQARAHLPGLDQRERAAARADAQHGVGGRRRGLHPMTSQCYADPYGRGARVPVEFG